MSHVFQGAGGTSYCKRCDAEVHASPLVLDLAEELVESVEAALEDPTLTTTVRVTKALIAWREQVPACKETGR